MLRMLLDFLSNALGSLSHWFRWKSSPVAQHDGAEARVSAEEAKALDRRAEVNRAVHGGDEDAVNRIVNGLALLWALVMAAGAFGCASELQLRMLRDDMWVGDKALRRSQEALDERVRMLELRIYHVERGELFDDPKGGPR